VGIVFTFGGGVAVVAVTPFVFALVLLLWVTGSRVWGVLAPAACCGGAGAWHDCRCHADPSRLHGPSARLTCGQPFTHATFPQVRPKREDLTFVRRKVIN
jgi:hypothetical protein